MSIDIDEFEAGEADERTNADRVLEFLARNDDEAWKAAAIAERTGVHPNSVAPVLSRLEERGLVRHDRPYWAIVDDPEAIGEEIDRETTPERVLEAILPDPLDDWLE